MSTSFGIHSPACHATTAADSIPFFRYPPRRDPSTDLHRSLLDREEATVSIIGGQKRLGTIKSPLMPMLALIRTRRRVYAESIDLIYSVPTFGIDSVFTIPSWAETTLPHRFGSMCSLSIILEAPQSWRGDRKLEKLMWRSTWLIIAGMRGLRVLRLLLSSLACSKSLKASKAGERALFAHLAYVKGVPDYEVTVDWQLRDGVWEDGDWPFRLVRWLDWT